MQKSKPYSISVEAYKYQYWGRNNNNNIYQIKFVNIMLKHVKNLAKKQNGLYFISNFYFV